MGLCDELRFEIIQLGSPVFSDAFTGEVAEAIRIGAVARLVDSGPQLLKSLVYIITEAAFCEEDS